MRRIEWVIGLLPGLLVALPAQAHDMSVAEIARLNTLVSDALASGWVGMLALLGSGVALGALHGLEPGHSKTMMSAFIVAIRGTVGQAALLGASATVSHTAVVWLLVVPVMVWGGAVDVARNEPYFQIASGLAVLAVAGFSLLRLLRVPRRAPEKAAPEHGQVIDTGHGLVRLGLETLEGKPHFVVRGVARSGRTMPFHETVAVEVARGGATDDIFAFVERDGAQISTRPVLPPHRFLATLRIVHGDHGHRFPVAFGAPDAAAMALADAAAEDAHTREHAAELQRRLADGRPMTRWQIVLFGLSGGLLPCPAAVTVLLLCLQLKRIGLGLLLVSSFSVGLALTMIAAGALAAVGTRHLSRRFAGFAAWSRPATYASCVLILAIGLYMLAQGIDALA